jgi:hypothetical protein
VSIRPSERHGNDADADAEAAKSKNTTIARAAIRANPILTHDTSVETQPAPKSSGS